MHPGLRRHFSVPTHLTDREKMTLFALARRHSRASRQGICAVEIGSYLGASASFIAAGFQHDTDRLACIDTWANDAMSEGNRDTYAEFLSNTRRHRKQLIPIRGWSTDPATVAELESSIPRVDLLFIDGDHSYEGALADWKVYGSLLSPEAVVVMHDIGWAEGVQRVVEEEIRPRVGREKRLPNLWWGQLTS